jgi:FKBP-type peptidyl-prolyl cis-trans isomerase
MGRVRFAAASLLPVLALGACSSGGKTDLESFEEKSSYVIGQGIGRQMVQDQIDVDLASLIQGVTDALDDSEPLITEEEAMQVMRELQAKVQLAQAQRREEMMAERDSMLARNTEEGEAFLAENGAREGVVITESGLQYEVLTQGNGPKPQVTDNVSVNYTGTLIDGTEFDSSSRSGGPVTFRVDQVIAGWTEVLQLMSVGSKYKVVIPANLAYGEQGSQGGIEPNATLVFEVELVGIEEQ